MMEYELKLFISKIKTRRTYTLYIYNMVYHFLAIVQNP